jgi:voltage-gated potassium channel
MKNPLYASIVENEALRRISLASVLMFFIFLIGSLGYHYIEGMSFFDGLYMSFITISTIGFTEVQTLSIAGRVFTMGLFVMGIGVISYIASQTTQLLFESELFLKRAMKKKLTEIENHYIVCGYGRIGDRISHVLRDAGLSVVIIENRAESIKDIAKDKFLYVEGNAQEEDVLIQAGIRKAKSLICTLSSDQNNVFTTLLARELNEDLHILVRSNEHKNRKRILRAGADKVISPYDVGADRMANVILRPKVEQFVEKITQDDAVNHTFEEAKIHEGSILVEKTVDEIYLHNTHEILVIAIIPHQGSIVFNPRRTQTLHVGDSLVVLGELTSIQSFKKEVCNDHRSLAEKADYLQQNHSV